MSEKPENQTQHQSVYADQKEEREAAIDTLPEAEKFLTPIPGDNPAGEYLRYEGTYDLINEAKKEDNASLPQGIWKRKLKKADWPRVYNIAIDALEYKTKDIQIAVWLTEALLHLHHFAGLAKGFEIITSLCEKFWDNIYPLPDEDDLERRLFPFFWLNEKLALRLKLIPVTNPQSGEHSPYNYADWERANMFDNLARKEKERYRSTMPDDPVTRAKFLGSVTFTSFSFYKKLYDDLMASGKNLDNLNGFLNKKCGRDSPSFKQLSDILNDITMLAGNFLNDKKGDKMARKEDTSFSGEKAAADDADEKKNISVSTPFLAIRNREEAYRMLNEAADYLHIHEPHSPTPYLVKRAVSWGQMKFEDLLKELVNDKNDLNQILKLLGITMKE